MNEMYKPRIVEVDGTDVGQNCLGVAYIDSGVIKVPNFSNRLNMLNRNSEERYVKVAERLKRYIISHELGELAGRPDSEEAHAYMDAIIIKDLLASESKEDVYAGVVGCILHDLRKTETGKEGEFSRIAIRYIPEIETYIRFAKCSGLYEEVEKLVGVREFDSWETANTPGFKYASFRPERRRYEIL